MADLNLPADVEVTNQPSGLWYPGLDDHRSPFGGQPSFLFNSPGSWRGSVSIAVTDAETEAMGATINGLLADMRAGEKTVALPMPGPTIEEPMVATTILSIATDGTLTLNRNQPVAPDAWIRIAERIFVARSQPAANQITVQPIGVAAVGERLHAADFITVRLAEASPIIVPRDPNFWGPFTFPWVEAV